MYPESKKFYIEDQNVLSQRITDAREGRAPRTPQGERTGVDVPPMPEGFKLSREKLLQKFHYKTRNVIRKALKHNINVVIDNSKLNLLYQLHKDNMESIGGIAKKIEIIDHIKQIYKENQDYKVYIAKYENKIVAGLLVFYFKETVEYYIPVINNEYRNLQALSLLIFEAMTEASVFGFKNWNWGGTWESQKGVYSFKKKWGTIDKNYYYLTKLNNEEIYTLDEETLLSEYSNFYVIPFKNLLKNE